MKAPIILFILITMAAISCNNPDNSKSGENQQSNSEMTGSDQIIGKHWKLVKLEGQEVKMAENQEKEIFFTLVADGNQVQGFAGCNTLNGIYSLEKGQRIRFSQMAVTLRACPDVAVDESEYLHVFELADNYTINGDELALNVGKRAPLALFKAEPSN